MGRFDRVHRSGLVVAALACLVAVARADEPRRTLDMSRAFDAGAAQVIAAPLSSLSPDPAPLAERDQWLLDLRWDRGEVWLLGSRKMRMATPRETSRAMGRFGLELYEGPTLVERVRFDFPLLGADLADRGDDSPSLTQKLRTRVGVLFPATARGNRLELWDRAGGRRWSIPWPLPDPLVSSFRPRPGEAGDVPSGDGGRVTGPDASPKRL